MIPLNDLSRICLASLFLTTIVSWLSVKCKIIERLRRYPVTDSLLTGANLCITAGALYLVYVHVFTGLVAVFLSACLWVIQFGQQSSQWMRPVAVNACVFLAALLVLQWFDALPFYRKLFMLYNIS